MSHKFESNYKEDTGDTERENNNTFQYLEKQAHAEKLIRVTDIFLGK